MSDHPINIVYLADYFFGSHSQNNHFPGMSKTAILIHECGHNFSSDFFHTKNKKGKYEYHQEGLQSNETNKCYPSLDNTIKIINDNDAKAYIVYK